MICFLECSLLHVIFRIQRGKVGGRRSGGRARTDSRGYSHLKAEHRMSVCKIEARAFFRDSDLQLWLRHIELELSLGLFLLRLELERFLGLFLLLLELEFLERECLRVTTFLDVLDVLVLWSPFLW